MSSGDPSRILKANSTRELGARVAFNFEDLQKKGEQYLAEIRLEAAKILSEAQTQAEQARSKLLETAIVSGKKEGLQHASEMIDKQVKARVDQEVAARVGTILPAVHQAAELLRAERDRWLSHWESQAVELTIAIASKLVRREFHRDSTMAQSLITEALKLAVGEPQVLVQLNPDDLAKLGTEAETLVRTISGCSQAATVADSNITPGGCVLQTRHGSIDARLETMMDRIADELLDRLDDPQREA